MFLLLSVSVLFLGLSSFLVLMVVDNIKTMFIEHCKDNAERRAIDAKLIDALNNIAEALKNGRPNQQVVQQPSSNDRIVNDEYPPQSPGHVETKQTLAHRVRIDATASAEEAGIASLVSKSVKSPVAFGEEA